MKVVSRVQTVVRLLTGCLIFLALSYPAAGESLAVLGETVYPVAGDPISQGVVLIEDGLITAVGPASEILIPEGFEIIEGVVVVPGLIDAHTVVGLAGYLNQDGDQDQLEESSAVQPELRAIDAYNARAPLISWLRGFGITTLHTGHGPGTVMSGQTMIVKTRGKTVEEATMVPVAMVAATMGEWATAERGKSPGNRSKVAALLRSELIAAQAYLKKLKKADQATGSKKKKKGAEEDAPEPPPRDLKLETLAKVIDGEIPLLINVQRHQDIMTALRLQTEFGFRLVLDGAAEAHLLTEEIKAAGVPIITHAPMVRAWGERENMTMEAAAILDAAGIPIAFQSGYESYVPKTRVVLWEAAIANAYGLGFEKSLRALTLGAAEILGIEDAVGSLEVGKAGDIAIFDGDPFEYTTHCTNTIIDGVSVSNWERDLTRKSMEAAE